MWRRQLVKPRATSCLPTEPTHPPTATGNWAEQRDLQRARTKLHGEREKGEVGLWERLRAAPKQRAH